MKKTGALLFLLLLFSCEENPQEVKKKVQDFLHQSYNEKFVITDISYYDSLKEGTFTHRESGWKIRAAPERNKEIQFSVAFNTLKKKNGWKRSQADFYLNELWRDQISGSIERLTPGSFQIISTRYTNIQSVYREIISGIKGKRIKNVPDFLSLKKIKPHTLEIEIRLQSRSGNRSMTIPLLVKIAKWLHQAKPRHLLIRTDYIGKKNSSQERLVFQFTGSEPPPGKKDLLKIILSKRSSIPGRFYKNHFLKGLSARRQSDTATALKEYSRIIDAYIPYGEYLPYFIESCWNSALIYEKQNRYAQADKLYSLIIKQVKLSSDHFIRTGRKPWSRERSIGIMDGKTHYKYYREAARNKRQNIR